MKRTYWSMWLGVILITISIITYTLQINLFHRANDTFFYLLQDFAFVPVQILLVTLVLNELLRRRSQQEMRAKLNMVIGVFMSEMGTRLLALFARADANTPALVEQLNLEIAWRQREVIAAQTRARSHAFAITCEPRQLAEMKSFLLAQRAFMLTLQGNPNLLEHEGFTDMLWAISHFSEELAYRDSLAHLPEADLRHLAGDMQRAYALLLTEWLEYLSHLCVEYPFIFSLVVRTNPYNSQASAIIH